MADGWIWVRWPWLKENLCRFIGHRLDIDLFPQGVNVAGCSRCGRIFKVDNRKPCSYETHTHWQKKHP